MLSINRIFFHDFSTYRSALMGVAIVFIMATHSIGRFALYGNIGVEWFLIVSAIGQFYSLSKDQHLGHYYKRRFTRILPTYLIVAIPFFILRSYPSFQDFIIRITGLNLFFWGERIFWFVTLIVICYLLAPFYFKLIQRFKGSFILPFLLVAITFPLSYHLPKTEILVTRLPIFFLAMNLGKLVYEKKTIEDKTACIACYILSFLAFLAVVLINYSGTRVQIHRFVYFFCGIPSLFFILTLVQLFSFSKGILSFIGNVSYEIYLLHESIILALCLMLPLPKVVNVLISYVLAIAFAYLLHSLVSLLFFKKRNSVDSTKG
ncbi:MAG: acyltransferase [Bacteroidales bacterium]|nr:acyltransferase [Bacteroidales bacterium]